MPSPCPVTTGTFAPVAPTPFSSVGPVVPAESWVVCRYCGGHGLPYASATAFLLSKRIHREYSTPSDCQSQSGQGGAANAPRSRQSAFAAAFYPAASMSTTLDEKLLRAAELEIPVAGGKLPTVSIGFGFHASVGVAPADSERVRPRQRRGERPHDPGRSRASCT